MTALAVSHSAFAHGIVGNRLFPGTLAFDDPAVADELFLPSFSRLKHPDEGGDVFDSRFDWSISRLLTPTIAAVIEGGWVHRNWGPAQRSGFDATTVGLKGLLFKNERHEIMVSAGLNWGLGYSGAQGVGASKPHTFHPGIFFGKGLGDLPDALAWLRPFGITGAITAELPTRHASAGLGIDETTGLLAPTLIERVETLHWGFSIQYSTYYLTKRFTGGPPKRGAALAAHSACGICLR